MSASEQNFIFDYTPSPSIYDESNRNKYDDNFEQMPPTVETFIELAQKLGYQEDEHITMMRTACMKTDYDQTENVSQAQGIATFERLCTETAGQHEATAERLIVRRGLRLSEASIYYHFGQTTYCIDQLRTVYEDVRHETADETDSSKEVAALLRYIAKRQVGQEAVFRAIESTA